MTEQPSFSATFRRIATIVIAGGVGSLMTMGGLVLLRPAILKPHVEGARVFSEPQPVGKIDGLVRSLRVKRGDDLSFRLIARINHVPVRMLVDTGANLTVLTRDDAARAGIPMSAGVKGDQIEVVGINNTTSQFRRAGLFTIGLGPIGLVSVPIAVDDSGELKNSILGQDAICGIDRVTIQSDEIELLHTRQIAQGCTDSE